MPHLSPQKFLSWSCLSSNNIPTTKKISIGNTYNTVNMLATIISIDKFYFATVSKSLLTVLGTSPCHPHRPPIVASGRPYLSRERTPLTSGRHWLGGFFICGGKNCQCFDFYPVGLRGLCGQALPQSTPARHV